MKPCTRCNQDKSLSEFHRKAGTKDGYHNWCKACRKEVYLENREATLAQRQEYRAENAEELRARALEYYYLNQEDRLAYRREYYIANREAELAYSQQYRAGHLDEEAARMRKYRADHQEEMQVYWRERYARRRAEGTEWSQVNREKHNAKRRRYHANKLAAEGSHTAVEWQAVLERYEEICLCCGATEHLEADHIVPLSIGGSNYSNNLQPLCRSCNAGKGARYVDHRPDAYWADWT